MFKPISFIAALSVLAASIALDASMTAKPAQAGFGIGIGTGFGFGRRSGIGFGTSFGIGGYGPSFGVGVGVGRPYRYGYGYPRFGVGARVLIDRPYDPNAVYPTVIVVPNGYYSPAYGYYSPGYLCGNTIYGSSIPSPVLVDPNTGLVCP